jgi:predicted AAA+ superfamily ATPase
LVETFVVAELRKQASWLSEPPLLGHWRTSDNLEVDLVLELDDSRVIAFEVKAAERVSARDFAGLSALRDKLGHRFVAGVAWSMGSRSYTYADRLHVMPIDRLWRHID